MLGIVMGFILFTNNAICADDVQILYKCNDINSTTTIIRPHLKVVNNGTTNLSLSQVKIRYWYTRDTDSTQSFVCDYAIFGEENVTGNFMAMTNPTGTADYYLEIGFTANAGNLAPGSDTGELQIRFNKNDWSSYTQTNDYSFDATKTTLAENVTITAYINDQLVFGTEPVATPLNKINVLQERRTLKAIITALDNGDPDGDHRYDMDDCFDGLIGTAGGDTPEGYVDYEYMRSNHLGDAALNATNPTYVQLEFTTAKNIKKLRAHLGLFDQDQTWKVEAANTQADLINHTGTYQLVVPESNEITGTQWVESVLTTAVTKKFWRFYIKATDLGDHGNVYVSELELYSDDNEDPSAPSGLAATSVDASTISLSWTGSTDNVEVSGYKVYRNGSYVGMTIVNKYTDTLLSPSTNYTYTVTAVDAVGNESDPSGSDGATTGNSTAMKTIQNVLVLYYDPIIQQGTYQYIDPVLKLQYPDQPAMYTLTKVVSQDIKYSELYDTHVWADFIAEKFAQDVKNATGGSVDFRIYQTVELNELPPANSPEWMTNDMLIEFTELRNQQHLARDYDVFHHGGFNYHKMIRDNNVISLVENGTIDAVWCLFASPNAGMWETSMSGNNAFWVNGMPNDMACSKKFVTYTGNSVECMGHMIESCMDQHTVTWPANSSLNVLNTYDLNDPYRTIYSRNLNDWQKFTVTDAYNSYGMVAPEYSQVGNFHNPANGYKNYSWLYIYDYFNNTDNWWVPLGDTSWQINANGEYEAANGPGVRTLWNENKVEMSSGFRNFTAEVKVKLDDDGGNGSNAGLIFRVSNYSEGADAFQGYYVGISAYNDQVILGKMNNNYEELASVTQTIDTDTFYRLKVVANDGNFTVYLNDIEVIDQPDTAFYYFPGALGLRSYYVTACFDDFFVNPSANSYADTWYNYPTLAGTASQISHDTWLGFQDGYQLWWFRHFPKNPGITSGFLNNWWNYAIDVNHFDGSAINYAVTGFPVPPPIDLKVQSVTSNSVTLAWTVPPGNSGVTGTSIYRDGVFLQSVTGSTYTDSGLTANTTYKYSVYTYNNLSTLSIPMDVEATTMTGTAFFSGFEKVTNNLPDGWLIRSGSGNVTFSADNSTGNKHSGTYSGMIVSTTGTSAMFYRTLPLKPRTEYQLTFWVKCSSLQNGSALVNLAFPYGSGINTEDITGDTPWTQITCTFNSENFTSVDLSCLTGWGATGTAWFDDVKLVEVLP